MRNGILAALGIILANSGIAFGQGYYPNFTPPGFYPPQPPNPVWQMQGLPQQMPMQQYPMQQYPGQQYPGQQMPMYPMQPMQGRPQPMPPQYYQGGMRDYPQPYSPVSRNGGPGEGQRSPAVDFALPPPTPSPNNSEAEKNSSPTFAPLDSEANHEDSGQTNLSPLEIPDRVPRGYSVYAQAEFLYWWFRKPDGPILFSDVGPRGTVNLDPQSLLNQQVLGGRTTIGTWLNEELTLALEGGGFYMGNRLTQTVLTPDMTISRPFFDLIQGMPSSLVLSPGSSGIITDRMRLYGAEINLRYEICRGSCGHLDVLTGPRFLQLDESFDIQTTDPVFGNITSDSFGTHNQFWGWQVGMEGEANWGPFFLKGSAKIAPGNLVQTVNIAGETNTNGIVAPGGFLAQPTNIGRYERSHFGLVPEAGLNVGMKFNEHVRIYGGYSVLFLTNAVRPGDQVDANINVFGTTPAGPLFQWKETNFWAQGFTAGLEIRY